MKAQSVCRNGSLSLKPATHPRSLWSNLEMPLLPNRNNDSKGYAPGSYSKHVPPGNRLSVQDVDSHPSGHPRPGTVAEGPKASGRGNAETRGPPSPVSSWRAWRRRRKMKPRGPAPGNALVDVPGSGWNDVDPVPQGQGRQRKKPANGNQRQ